MKKILLALVMVAASKLMLSQSVPNGGFENWNVTSYNDLMYWYCSNEDNKGNPANVTQVNDPFHGSYAALLSTVMSGTNVTFAFIANGDPMKPAGQGVPYNQQATGLTFHYKLNTMPNDSALVWVIFKKSGSVIGDYLIKLSGTQTTYALKSYPFSLPMAPDSMIFAAASSNPFNYTGPAGSTFQLDSVNFTGVSSQPTNFNGSFEQWQTVSSATPLGWDVNSSNMNAQTTDMYSGNYAIRLQTISSGTIAYAGGASNGIPSPSTTLGGTPYSNQNDTLVFYYKYAPTNSNDSAKVTLNFKKNFVYFAATSTLVPSSGTYKKVKMLINLGMAPDTMLIFLSSSKNYTVPLSYGGAELKIDNMYLTSQVVPVTDFTMTTSACSGQTLQLLDNSSNLPTAYTWTMSGATPSTSTLQNPIVNYTSPGTYTIMHNVSNTYGNGSVATKTISVNLTPTLSVTGFNTLCTGSSVVLSVTGATSYLWTTGANSSTIVVSPTVNISYSVTGTTTAGCMGTAYMTLTVNPLPTITASSTSTLICAGQSATLTSMGGSSYTWTPGGVAPTIVVSPTTTSTYSIVGKDANGCLNTATFTQSVSACSSVHEFEMEGTGLLAYPNPNNGSFILKSNSDEQVIITNELGQQIKFIELNSTNNYSFQVNDLATGIYFANGKSSKFKIVIFK